MIWIITTGLILLFLAGLGAGYCIAHIVQSYRKDPWRNN